jgi:hypothetical protein
MFKPEQSNLTNQALNKPTISKMVNGGLSSPANVPVTNVTPSTLPQVKSKKSSLKLIIGGILLFILVLGSGTALYLSQSTQDVRQRANTCNYWVGGGATGEGSCDCRGGVAQKCVGGYWSAPGSECANACGNNGGGGNASPVASPITGSGCANGNCTSPDGGCIAIHHCDSLSNGECTILTPDVTTGTVNAQQEANNSCQCVQVDVLTGGSGSCVNGHINEDWSTLIGAIVVCPDASANCGGGGGTSPNPTSSPNPTGSPDPSTNPSPSPSASPITYFCNSNCTTDHQCKTADNNFFCSDEGKCRLTSNPSSVECRPAVGPMCLDVAVVNSVTGTEITADPKFNDSIKFTCANVEGITNYAFRVVEPDGAIKTLTATGRVSEAYTITKSGKFFAQCQICASSDPLSCNAFEALE